MRAKRKPKTSIPPLLERARNGHGLNAFQMWKFRFMLGLVMLGIGTVIYSWNEKSVIGLVVATFLILDGMFGIYELYVESGKSRH